MAYGGFAAAQSVAGIGILKSTSAQALIEQRFFCTCVMAGVMGALSSARFLVGRNANPVASATFLIGIDGGGSLITTRAHTMSNLIISNREIRQIDDFYCLNDLHKAGGGEQKHRPSKFVRTEQTKGLIAKIDLSPNMGLALKVLKGGGNPGTYACKQIILAYGMWISSELYLAVINAFLDRQEEPRQPKPAPPQTLTPAQQRHVQERAAVIVNSDDGFTTYRSLYSKIKTRFQVGTYKDIPRSRYPELCRFLHCLPRGELPKSSKSPEPSPEQMFHGLRDGRYLLLVRDGKTAIEDATGKNLVDAKHVHTLRRNCRILTSQMRACFGEADEETMGIALEDLPTAVER